MLEKDYKPITQPQRRLNPTMKKVVIKEVLKLLEASMIYLIFDSILVSLVHVVPKKGGIIVISDDKNQWSSTRTIIEWRMCINYMK